MTKKRIIRFLKFVTMYSLLMASFVTVAVLYICYRANEISGTVVTALCGLWSIELGLSALIKVSEGKTVQNEKPKEEEFTTI